MAAVPRTEDLLTMDRRTFTRLTAMPFAVGVLSRPHKQFVRVARQLPPDLRVDGMRLNRRLAELVRFGGTPEGGTHRVAYSDEDIQARAWVRGLMEDAGLDVSIDLAGNLIGRRTGADSSLPPIVLGSHTDSVPAGGNYDGQVGSMAAVEVATVLAAAEHRTTHPLEFVIWANEEGGKTGSRAVVGEVERAELDIVTASGFTIAEGTRRIGGDADRFDEAVREAGSLTAYLELHIEQGAVLEQGGTTIGIVEGIVGIKRWTVTVEGIANHAGTTPMDQRRDAMVTAARIIQVVNRIAVDTPGRQVATVGQLLAEPGAPNVIPGRVVFSLEIRDLEMGKIDTVFGAIEEAAQDIAADTGTRIELEQFYLSRAAPTDPRLRDVIEGEARRLGLSTLRMPSGAGHDAQSIALLGPAGMIFVPSRGGMSHSPLEYTSPDQVTAGANVLLCSLLAIDAGGL